jgi:hypothetical protein
MRLAVSDVIVETMNKLPIDYPKLKKEQLANLKICKDKLENEK